MKEQSILTQLIHAGETKEKGASVITPIYQSSIYSMNGKVAYKDLKYIRHSNSPAHNKLHQRLAKLEGAEQALLSANGMAAVTTTVMSLVKPGDRILVQQGAYGGCHSFFKNDLTELGVEVCFINLEDLSSLEAELKNKPQLLFLEAISNPLIKIFDLEKISGLCQSYGIISVIDSTLASPINLNPLKLGFDIVIHSCSKYINGHTDILAGAIIGPTKFLKTITHKQAILGGALDPNSCFLLERGMKTLGLRVRQQNESALKISQFLEKHDKISKVNYPGLESSVFYSRAKKYMPHGQGGLLSFELKEGLSPEKFIESLQLATHAPSLGGVETLVICPCDGPHKELSVEEQNEFGISSRLIRISVGIEEVNDLIFDLESALQKL